MKKQVFLSLYVILSTVVATISFWFANSYITYIKTSTGGKPSLSFLALVVGFSIFYCVLIFFNGAFHNKYINAFFIILYFIVLFIFLFLKTADRRSINLNPSIILYMLNSRARIEIVWNILAFLGIPIIVKRISNRFYCPLVALFFILIEFLQYAFSRGSCDIADLFAYFVAYGIGMLAIFTRDKFTFLPKYGKVFNEHNKKIL